MGLDQYFYQKNPKEKDSIFVDQVVYFRKNWGLHDKIEQILGKPVENCSCVYLNDEQLNRVAHFLRNDETYWGRGIEAEQGFEYFDSYLSAVGALLLYKGLWYCPDW
jgi:hypothetical protein